MNRRDGQGRKAIPMSRWFFLSMVRNALFPLILVECVFIAIYFFANNWVRDRNIEALKQTASDQLVGIASREGAIIQNRLLSISQMTDTYRNQVLKAFDSDDDLDPEDRRRLKLHPDGAFYSESDRPDGGAAVFYSGYVAVGPREQAKAVRLLHTQGLMKDMLASEPLASAIYVNTNDSLNIIYPYFDVLSQYPMKMDIPSYNFYYEADKEHNPSKGIKWTSAYLDPAGNGWMASSIAPVYRGDRLEAVVGIDVTVDTIAKQITGLVIPWGGYGILVSKDGTILALPEKGEQDWGLTELTTHHYDEAIRQDTFKPSQFNIYNRSEMAEHAALIRGQAEGLVQFELNGRKQFATWSTIPGIDWKLMVLVPEEQVYAVPNALKEKLFSVGTWMLAGLVLFYILYFAYMLFVARRSSYRVTKPLVDMNRVVGEIGHGFYRQVLQPTPIQELNETGGHIIRMGEELGNYQESLLSARDAAEKASRAKSEFLSRMSHELRTPMNAILGFAQLLELDVDGALNADQKEHVHEILLAGEHLQSLINEVLDLSRIESGHLILQSEAFVLKDVVLECLALVQGLADKNQVGIWITGELEMRITSDRTRLKQVILNLLSNAVKYNRPGGTVQLQAALLPQGGWSLSIEDSGIGIDPSDLEAIFTPFYRVLRENAHYIEGTGIGLAVAKQIVESLNGRINVTSRLGSGSRFWFEM